MMKPTYWLHIMRLGILWSLTTQRIPSLLTKLPSSQGGLVLVMWVLLVISSLIVKQFAYVIATFGCHGKEWPFLHAVWRSKFKICEILLGLVCCGHRALRWSSPGMLVIQLKNLWLLSSWSWDCLHIPNGEILTLDEFVKFGCHSKEMHQPPQLLTVTGQMGNPKWSLSLFLAQLISIPKFPQITSDNWSNASANLSTVKHDVHDLSLLSLPLWLPCDIVCSPHKYVSWCGEEFGVIRLPCIHHCAV